MLQVDANGHVKRAAVVVSGRGAVSVAAQIASVVGCLGLAALLLATGRPRASRGSSRGVRGSACSASTCCRTSVARGSRRPPSAALVIAVGARRSPPLPALRARLRDARLHPAAAARSTSAATRSTSCSRSTP